MAMENQQSRFLETGENEPLQTFVVPPQHIIQLRKKTFSTRVRIKKPRLSRIKENFGYGTRKIS